METKDVALPKSYPREGDPTAPHAYYLYFVYCAGRVKIGRAVNVAERISNLSTGCPFKPTLLLSVSASLSGDRTLRARFSPDQVHREWFRLSDRLRRYLVARLDDQGLTAFRRAEEEFRDSFLPVPEQPHKWKNPPELCSHRRPMSKPCAKCTKEADMRVYGALLDKMNAQGGWSSRDVL
jgi:hypothetical protein